jgi:deoxyribodipyrimidine photo-lyase
MTGVVWFKRDLRTRDHAPLLEAARRGSTVALYIYEPEILHAPEFDPSHLDFINDSLRELSRNLQRIGARLVTRVGEASEVLERLHLETSFQCLFSHEETGNAVTYARDRRVKAWCRTRAVRWLEFKQHGVLRGSAPRPAWALHWDDLMRAPIAPTPSRLNSPDLETSGVLSPGELGLEANSKAIQGGGSHAGYDLLESFLTHRGRDYQRAMSSPEAGWDTCSRLSPHLALGTVSLREAFQRNLEQFDVYKHSDLTFARSLQSFNRRLHWHCHFMQKLEDLPELEFQNQNRAFDGLREASFNRDLFDAFREGRTGYPLVDACVRCLLAKGWINFRMRAMLVSFAAYHLWLHWREVGVFLARHFLDFEAGIHWSQMQMQSAVTGTNTVRVYSAIKQAKEQDPTGAFIRRWVPELERVPLPYLHQPETLPPLLISMLEVNYPAPIVIEREALRLARDRVYTLKRSPQARLEATRLLEQHSRMARIPALNRDSEHGVP